MIFRLLDTGRAAGAFNMRMDEELASGLAGRAPALRLYGWTPPAVSLGRHQPAGDLDAERLARDGIDLVRRPTGGKAILHWNELTYSVVLPIGASSLREIYLLINRGILAGLRLLGVDAALSGRESDFRSAYAQPGSMPCFATTARNEIHAGGRKLVGSAQRRYGETVLQHGSILLGAEHLRITDYLVLPGEEMRTALRRALERSTTTLGELLGRPVGHEEAADAVRSGFESACGIRFREAAEPIHI